MDIHLLQAACVIDLKQTSHAGPKFKKIGGQVTEPVWKLNHKSCAVCNLAN